MVEFDRTRFLFSCARNIFRARCKRGFAADSVRPVFSTVCEARMRDENALVLGTREIEASGGAHIAGALNIASREDLWREVSRHGQGSSCARVLLLLAMRHDETLSQFFYRVEVEDGHLETLARWVQRDVKKD